MSGLFLTPSSLCHTKMAITSLYLVSPMYWLPLPYFHDDIYEYSLTGWCDLLGEGSAEIPELLLTIPPPPGALSLDTLRELTLAWLPIAKDNLVFCCCWRFVSSGSNLSLCWLIFHLVKSNVLGIIQLFATSLETFSFQLWKQNKNVF